MVCLLPVSSLFQTDTVLIFMPTSWKLQMSLCPPVNAWGCWSQNGGTALSFHVDQSTVVVDGNVLETGGGNTTLCIQIIRHLTIKMDLDPLYGPGPGTTDHLNRALYVSVVNVLSYIPPLPPSFWPVEQLRPCCDTNAGISRPEARRRTLTPSEEQLPPQRCLLHPPSSSPESSRCCDSAHHCRGLSPHQPFPLHPIGPLPRPSLPPPLLHHFPSSSSSSILVLAVCVCWSEPEDGDGEAETEAHAAWRGREGARGWTPLLPPLFLSSAGGQDVRSSEDWRTTWLSACLSVWLSVCLPACWGNWSAGGSAPVSCCSS